ncbi:Holliday junction branch migration protein RuvA [Halothermothrix orenii]|uniref:Holliday junction branch migration complex subunit RuvA n=1 Tax=Halothermothrix orenii (strain H 168 / OCM 544 / DSM 9562) TaxID=373903 RepID=RUVA_HALOH|nr:Holliday junction branch migration protein RuvA [Halothermothrix orenii]B8CXG3.1 RecName: Full=Holliday junction branch migration complex subunit RuvA [Halothermothrix orenii H 168]ACL69982.1 Holliday junction DNA helicase RuvA [Halothermothrix orenii H 168]
MIGYLKGNVIWKAENKVILETGGVGYRVLVPSTVRLKPVGEKLELFVYTYVREDSLDLYGFKTMEERELFETLLSVSGIGPRAAINILSSLSYKKFIEAILTEKVSILKQVSGIGPKTAKRLILELKGKLKDMSGDFEEPLPDNRNTELSDALASLGYSELEIEEALSNADIKNNGSLEENIKKALGYLGSKGS